MESARSEGALAHVVHNDIISHKSLSETTDENVHASMSSIKGYSLIDKPGNYRKDRVYYLTIVPLSD